jgi:sugar transferase (PEP-CTERM/EpsH1 system associated)
MRLLFIIPYAPTRIRTRPHHFLRALARRGHALTLATLWQGAEERRALDEMAGWGVRVTAFPLERWRVLANLAVALATGLPLQGRYSWDARLAAAITQVLADGHFDAVHVEHLRGAVYGRHVLDSAARPPVVWDSVDSISNLFEQSAQMSRSRFGRWAGRLELARTRRYEGRMTQAFDRVLVTSAADRDALLGLSPARRGARLPVISILPNGVDGEAFHPIDGEFQSNTIVFTGKMSYHANVTAIMQFVDEVMPRIWAQKPDAELWVVGKDPVKQVRNLENRGRVRVFGTVPDLQPYLARAAVAVAPIAYGAGIQNKVLEAMACRTPVVASPQAASALEEEGGRGLVLAENPVDFAGAVLRLLEDRTWRDDVAERGYQYIQRHHRWDELAARLEDVYDGAIGAFN